MINTLGFLVSGFFIIVTFLLAFYKTWLPKVNPNLFKRLNIYEDNLTEYKEHLIFLPFKKDQLDFLIDNCVYTTKKRGKRNKQIWTWNYLRGNSIPIDFQFETDNKLDASLVKKMQDTKIDSLWYDENTIKDFLKDYGILILGFLMIILFFYVMNQNSQITLILRNISIKG